MYTDDCASRRPQNRGTFKVDARFQRVKGLMRSYIAEVAVIHVNQVGYRKRASLPSNSRERIRVFTPVQIGTLEKKRNLISKNLKDYHLKLYTKMILLLSTYCSVC